MYQLLVLLRTAQLATHSFHLLCARPLFFQDHEFFGESYKAFEDAYDSIFERILGTKGEAGLDIKVIHQQVQTKLANVPSIGVKENKLFYQSQLAFENELCSLVSSLCKMPECSEGTKQLLGDLCNASETRQYKIKQRIK